MRVLLADDEAEIARALKTMLERSQYTVDVAQDGREALDFLENASYDAVVLDVMMPQLDGLTVLRRMRAAGNSTPTLLLTAKSGIVTMHDVYLSMFFAYATLYPDTYLLLFFLIPVKIKWLAIIDAVLFGLGVLFGTFPANLLPLVALLNYFLFCGQWIGDLLGRSKVQRQKNVIDFQRESRRINREMREKPYNHKCEICGRTDAEYPDLEFRYCSRCSGYHCYCQDHINNHVHHTD